LSERIREYAKVKNYRAIQVILYRRSKSGAKVITHINYLLTLGLIQPWGGNFFAFCEGIVWAVVFSNEANLFL